MFHSEVNHSGDALEFTPAQESNALQTVESLENSNSEMRSHIEFLNVDLESERKKVHDMRLELVRTQQKLKQAEIKLRAPLARPSQAPSSKEIMLQRRVEALQQQVTDLSALSTSNETRTRPSQETQAYESRKNQDVQQPRIQKAVFNKKFGEEKRQSSAQETRLSEKISPQPPSTNISGGKTNPSVDIVLSSIGTASAGPAESLAPTDQSSANKSSTDAVRSKPLHEMSDEEYGEWLATQVESDPEIANWGMQSSDDSEDEETSKIRRRNAIWGKAFTS